MLHARQDLDDLAADILASVDLDAEQQVPLAADRADIGDILLLQRRDLLADLIGVAGLALDEDIESLPHVRLLRWSRS
jgi:hypothetical protein